MSTLARKGRPRKTKRYQVRREVVLEWLALRGMKQYILADRLGIPPPYLSQLLSGRRSPGDRVREAMVRVLEIDAHILFVEVPRPVDDP
jgi:transcriptional regulator with XRE-family HTH domain